jgi:hypothetical protein
MTNSTKENSLNTILLSWHLFLLLDEMEIEVNKVFSEHKFDQQQNNILLMIKIFSSKLN